MAEKITADTILKWAQEQVESKNMPSREVWLDIAFRLNLLKIDEAALLNKMRQAVAQTKYDVLKAQDKKNVAAATLEVECSDAYRFMRDQEAKLEVIEEFVRIAKRNADLNF